MWPVFPSSDYDGQLRLPYTHHIELVFTLVLTLPAVLAGNIWISWVQSYISINSPTPATPVVSIDWNFQITFQHSWPATLPKVSAIHNRYFGAITFTIWFRLEYFAVYASSLLLPPATQDSLCSTAGTVSTTGLAPVRYTLLFPAHWKNPQK